MLLFGCKYKFYYWWMNYFQIKFSLPQNIFRDNYKMRQVSNKHTNVLVINTGAVNVFLGFRCTSTSKSLAEIDKGF